LLEHGIFRKDSSGGVRSLSGDDTGARTASGRQRKKAETATEYMSREAMETKNLFSDAEGRNIANRQS
jgi:hypothetical protein